MRFNTTVQWTGHSRSSGDRHRKQTTDNTQGPKAWVDLHEPSRAGNPESFNVRCVATNQRNGASEAPVQGYLVVLYSPGSGRKCLRGTSRRMQCSP